MRIVICPNCSNHRYVSSHEEQAVCSICNKIFWICDAKLIKDKV